MRIPWDRCDAIGCDNNPLALIEIHAVSSMAPEKKYSARIRVCATHWAKEQNAPTFIRLIKKRNMKN